MPNYNHFTYNMMTAALQHVAGAVKLLADGADW
jgi:hypothetical protein